MLEYAHGNLLQAQAQALVNTVNTEGVMGKGIALQFKKAFPDNFRAYAKACKDGELTLGKMFIYDRSVLEHPRFIINFPTKGHWKQKSRIEDIKAGLEDLRAQVRALGITSLAVPPLGSGLGGLPWAKVRPLIAAAFEREPEVKVSVYEPTGAPAAGEMPNRTETPRLTKARAAVLSLMKRYRIPEYGYRLSLLEVQKLAYFFQESGQPLKLNFQKHTFGPYADNLRHVLNVLEGHYLTGYGDGKNSPETEIKLLPSADQVEDILESSPEIKTGVEKVAALIEGFETPYGMELLSTVHWVIRHDGSGPELEAVVQGVHGWNERKQTMPAKHIDLARQRLIETGWI